MKKLWIVGMLVATMAFTFTGCGGGGDQNISTSAAVPNKVLSEFYDMYPTAEDVNWKVNDGLYEADFEVGDKEMKATYTSGGDLVRVDS
jgi:hypothetical protein